MKNFTTILFMLALTVISACQENTESPVGVFLDTGIMISIKSAEGTDLLNPDNPGHFAEDQIRIFMWSMENPFRFMNLILMQYMASRFLRLGRSTESRYLPMRPVLMNTLRLTCNGMKRTPTP